MFLCECCAWLSCVCVSCPLSGLHGGEEVVWIRSYLLGNPWSCSMSSWISSLHFSLQSTSLLSNCIHCDFVFNLSCALLKTTACLSVLGERSLLCSSSWWFLPFFSPLKFFLREFFLIWVEGLRTEGVVCYTDCKAPWGKLWFVILGYTNKNGLDLTWNILKKKKNI